MNQIRIKVCCIASIAEADMAIAAGADAIGLVSAMPSGPGPISDHLIMEIADHVAGRVETFLLTSRTEPEAVVDHVRMCGTTTVQLVDAVPEETYSALKKYAPDVDIVQVIHVTGPDATAQAQTCANFADIILLDSGNPHAETRTLGGTGRIHNWQISRDIIASINVPVFLAGGLKPENVGAAIHATQPYGVDLCSGVRTDGNLDQQKLASFFTAVEHAAAYPH